MKEFSEILSNPRISVVMNGIDGFSGLFAMPTWRGSVICSHGAGWNHVSVSPFKKNYIPSWHDMVMIKNIFWDDEEAVIQIHPPKSQYVNNMDNCLHLWECYYREMVLPPSCLVGIREGQTNAELKEEIKKAYELAGEVYE